MAYVTINQLKDELLFFLRNSDIFTITQRGVTTTTSTGTYAADSTDTIAVSTIKNIRSIVVGGTTLTYGSEYTYDVDDTVSTKCKITFISAQTGVYTITYDYGSTDKIFPDYPQANLKLNQFPRIGFDIISGETKENEIGAGSNDSEYILSISVYSKSQRNTEDFISSIREALMGNKKDFHYIKFITPSIMSPMIQGPFGEQKIMQRSQDFRILFIYEW